MVRSLFAGMGMLVVLAGGAEAEEMMPVYDWTGWSVGVFGGISAGHFDQTELFTDAFGGNWWFPPGPNPSYDYGDRSAMFGLQADWSYQAGNLVTGVGIEVGHFGLVEEVADPNALPIPFPGPAGPVTDFDDVFGSLTGRVGFASDRWLVYLRGGVSVLAPQARTVDECGRSFCGQLTINAKGEEFIAGLTAGAGVEYAFGENFTVGAEYRAYQFENLKISGVASNLLEYHQTVSLDLIQTARISLNYKF